ncbi:hypothetical protein Q9189_007560 [Teloschistes chrysophthalmus]
MNFPENAFSRLEQCHYPQDRKSSHLSLIDVDPLPIDDASILTAHANMPHQIPSLKEFDQSPVVSLPSQKMVVDDGSLQRSRRSTTSTLQTQDPVPEGSGTDTMLQNRQTTSRPTGNASPAVHTYDPSYTNSRTWVSPHIREKDEWKRVNNGIHSMNLNHTDHSPLVPKTFDEFLQHKADYLSDRKKAMQAKYTTTVSGDRSIGQAFGGISFNDGRGAVLAYDTIWCPWDEPTAKHPRPPWPHREEMREEGDERHTSQFGRFLALPRNPGNDTVTYKQRSPVKQHYMDRVWDVPDPEEMCESFEEKEMEALVGEGLLGELDL